MNRLEFIFSAVNAIASKRHESITEYLLVEAVQREIEGARRERCATFAVDITGKTHKRKEQNAAAS